MNFMKFWAIALALVLTLVLVGCNTSGSQEKTNPSNSTVETDEIPNEETSGKVEEELPEDPNKIISDSLERVGVINGTLYTSNGATCAVYSNQNYVLTNIVQNKTTQTTYVKVSVMDDFFVVTQKSLTDKNDFASINSTGVISVDLEQTVPCEYAIINKIAKGYAVAYKLTEITENRDEALSYITSNMFSIKPEEGDTFYKGEWCVIELATGRKLEGLSGTAVPSFYLNGDVITARMTGHKDIRRTFSGKTIPEEANLLENGCYIPNNENTCYTSHGVKLFDFEKGAQVVSVDDDCFMVGVMNKTTYKMQYTIVDTTGTAISVSFDSRPTVYCGALVVHNNNVYTFDGTKIAEGSVSTIHRQGSFYWIQFKNRVLIVDLEYNAVLDLSGEALHMDRNNFLIGKETENYKVTYYSVPQQEFVYQGTSVGTWLVQMKTEKGNHTIVNVLTDEVLISEYYVSSVQQDSAGNIYFVISENGQKVLYQLKNNMM